VNSAEGLKREREGYPRSLQDLGQAGEIIDTGIEDRDAGGEELVAGAEGGDAGRQGIGHCAQSHLWKNCRIAVVGGGYGCKY